MMTSLRTVLAFNMRDRRRILGLSQAKLAEKVDTSTNYIATIEAGKKFPTPEMLERIAGALEIDAPDLFSTGEFMPEKAETVEKFQELVLTDMAKVLAFRLKEMNQGQED
jgi:transcriptional regulator with XRE-family HTH domain